MILKDIHKSRVLAKLLSSYDQNKQNPASKLFWGLAKNAPNVQPTKLKPPAKQFWGVITNAPRDNASGSSLRET